MSPRFGAARTIGRGRPPPAGARRCPAGAKRARGSRGGRGGRGLGARLGAAPGRGVGAGLLSTTEPPPSERGFGGAKTSVCRAGDPKDPGCPLGERGSPWLDLAGLEIGGAAWGCGARRLCTRLSELGRCPGRRLLGSCTPRWGEARAVLLLRAGTLLRGRSRCWGLHRRALSSPPATVLEGSTSKITRNSSRGDLQGSVVKRSALGRETCWI